MDINEQLQPVISSLLENIKVTLEEEVQAKVSAEIISRISNLELESIVNSIVAKQLEERLSKYNFEATSKHQLDLLVKDYKEQFDKNLVQEANKEITKEINKQLEKLDLQTAVSASVESKIAKFVNQGAFPQAGIPHTAINFSGLKISGDSIKGGIIENFGSTGIEDRATHVQMTLMDHATAFEGPLFAPSAEIRGSLTVEGDLIVKGDIPSDCLVVDKLSTLAANKVKQDSEWQDINAKALMKRIDELGLDLNKITQNGREVVSGAQLGYHIVDSNLQRVGMLRDLQTLGESYLSETLYISNGRIGINTLEPSSVFAVWDQEVEMSLSKKGQDTGYLGTPRYQKMILGSNSKDNLKLNVDGSVEVNNLIVNKVSMGSNPGTPNWDGPVGQIMWNESPATGSPIGWVCLGGARWARFGTIE